MTKETIRNTELKQYARDISHQDFFVQLKHMYIKEDFDQQKYAYNIHSLCKNERRKRKTHCGPFFPSNALLGGSSITVPEDAL